MVEIIHEITLNDITFFPMSMIFWVTVLPITDTNTPWNVVV